MFVHIHDVTKPIEILEQLGFRVSEKYYRKRSSLALSAMICFILCCVASLGAAGYSWYQTWLFFGAFMFTLGNICAFTSWILFGYYSKEEVLYIEDYTFEVDDIN